MSGNKNSSHSFRTLTRFLVGSVFIGIDEISGRVQRSEVRISQNKFPEIEETEDFKPSKIPEEMYSHRFLEYAISGLIFETQDWFSRKLRTIDNYSRKIDQFSAPYINPVIRSRPLSPVRKGIEILIKRGELELFRVVELGKRENARSRNLVTTTLDESVDNGITYFAEKEEIQILIQSQGVGLGSEILEEIRERAISSDNLLEGVVRKLLGRPNRLDLPEPSAEIKLKATPPSRVKGRVIRQ